MPDEPWNWYTDGPPKFPNWEPLITDDVEYLRQWMREGLEEMLDDTVEGKQ